MRPWRPGPNWRRVSGASVSTWPAAAGAPAPGPAPLPALVGRLETVDAGLLAVLSLAEAPDAPLAEAVATPDDRLIVTLHPAGAALAPGLPPGETTIELLPPAWPG